MNVLHNGAKLCLAMCKTCQLSCQLVSVRLHVPQAHFAASHAMWASLAIHIRSRQGSGCAAIVKLWATNVYC